MSIRSFQLLAFSLLASMIGNSQTLTSGPTVATNADGRLELFATGSDGTPYHAWQNSPGGSWTGWNSLGGTISGAPVATVNADGRLEVFGFAGGGVYHNYQTSPGGGWSGWIWIGGTISAPPTVAMNFDGRLELFARGTDGAGWTASQVIPGGNVWTTWSSFGGSITGSPAPIQNADGRLEIFARGGNTAYHMWQTVPGGQWSSWNPLTGTYIASDPTVAINNDGRLEVFAQGTDNAGWHIWQATPGGGWSNWNSLGGIITGSPNGDADGSGNINIFVVNPNGSPYYDTQANGWAGWTFLGGAILYAPSIAMNFDGRQEIFGLAGGSVYHNWQLAPAGPWSGWALLATPSNSGDTNGADLAFFMSDAQDDAYYASNNGRNCSSKMPNMWGGTVGSLTRAWPCGALVNLTYEGFPRIKPLEKARQKWNNKIQSWYSQYTNGVTHPNPAALWNNSGGPQKATASTTCNTCIQGEGGYGRGVTNFIGFDASNRLAATQTQLIEALTKNADTALQDVFAHEIGHTFGLADCPVGAVDGPLTNNPLYDCSGTVMASNLIVAANTASFTLVPSGMRNGQKYYAQGFELFSGPTSCDMQVIDQNLPDYRQCYVLSDNIPDMPACTNGTSVGFMDTASGGEYTCSGAACDGCNSACSNFAPQKCSGGGGRGGGGQTCSNWCGSVCMDNAVCSCPGDTPTCQENSGGYFPACDNSCSPVVVDAFNEGFHLTDMNHGVKFRIAPNGPLLQMSWPDQDYRNGWLALDRNGNGTIDDFTELFGNMTPQASSDDPNGYHALAIFDDPINGGNGNGVIDPEDSVYSQLRLWIDANHNGLSEPGELHTLPEMGIFRIDLKYHLSKYVDANGNTFRYRSRIWDDAGHGHDVCYDVFLSVQPIQAGTN